MSDSSKGLKVLIVDNDDAYRSDLIESLYTPDRQIDDASDGREALNMLQLAPYDVLITNVVLPSLNGIDLVETLRQAGACPSTVVAISSFTVPTVRDRLKALDVNLYLSKLHWQIPSRHM